MHHFGRELCIRGLENALNDDQTRRGSRPLAHSAEHPEALVHELGLCTLTTDNAHLSLHARPPLSWSVLVARVREMSRRK
jgi:hypothetical protein